MKKSKNLEERILIKTMFRLANDSKTAYEKVPLIRCNRLINAGNALSRIKKQGKQNISRKKEGQAQCSEE